MNRSLIRFFALGAIATALSASAFAGDRHVTPLGKIPTIRAVRESTRMVFPQIQDLRLPGIREHENPMEDQFHWFTEGAINSLPVGGMLSSPRVSVPSPSTRFPAPQFPGIGATGWVPPDPTGAASSGYVVEIVNSAVAFFRRDGVKLFQQNINGASGFFGSVGATDFVFDPKVFFDAATKRFFIVALEEDDTAKISFFNIAVSSGEDPRGTWLKYRIDNRLVSGSDSFWLDYPGWGFTKDWIVAGGNMYGFPGNTAGWGGVQVFALNKANLIAGNTGGSFRFQADTFTIQWAKTSDPTASTTYGVADGDSSTMELWAVTGPVTKPSLVSTTVAVPTWQAPSGHADSFGGRQLATLDGRMLTSAYYGGNIVASHTVALSDGRAAARWYEFRTNGWPASGNPSLVQSGNVTGGPGEHAYMPAINLNKFGQIALIYTRSSPTITADVMITGHRVADPLGFMGLPTKIEASNGAYGSGFGVNRWGDYFSVEVDPVNGRTFWGVAMGGLPNGDWTTFVDTWNITVPQSYDPTSISTLQGAYVFGNLASVLAADGSTYDIASVRLGALGNVAAAKITYPVSAPLEEISEFSLSYTASTNQTTTLIWWMLNKRTGVFDYQSSTNLGPGSSTKKLVAFPKNVGDYIDSKGVATVVVRALAPVHLKASPPPFRFKLDQVQLGTE